jgi:crotonobetainyl-CoA:carnitine CoA-transferase CaiB-like acyl-CoA transferase
VSVRDDEEWAGLCQAIGQPELAADPHYATNDARMENHDEIDAIIAAWTRDVSKFDAMHKLQAAGVRAGAVFNARDMHLDSHAKARGMLEKVKFPPRRNMGERVIIGRPWRLKGRPLAVRGPAPTLGQHNRDVIQGILGYDDARYGELERTGIVATIPTAPRKIVQMDMDERVDRGRLASWDPDYKERLGIED